MYTPIGHTFAIIMDRSLIVVEAGLFELCTRLRVILLDGANVHCIFFCWRAVLISLVRNCSIEVIRSFFTAPPQLPDAVSQDHSQDTVDRTTVINWQPATVDSASDEVTYTVASGSDLIMDFDNPTTSATVVLPAFNTDYSFCVEAVNVCEETSVAPRCATPPVRIGAESKYNLYTRTLHCGTATGAVPVDGGGGGVTYHTV